MTRTPKAASAESTARSTTNSEADELRAAGITGPPSKEVLAAYAVDTALMAEPQATRKDRSDAKAAPVDYDAAAPAAPSADGSDSDSSDGEIPLCDAPVAKKRRVAAQTSSVNMTDSDRYKKDDAKCAERLKERAESELLPCVDPDLGEDDGGVADRFQGYDGFTISGPPVFR